MITKIKSSKTAALKLSMGVLVAASLLAIFAFDNEQNQVQNKKTTDKQAKAVTNEQQKSKQTEELGFFDPEESATFQGGDVQAFHKWVQKNVNYPATAKAKGISGKVFVQYTINTSGEVVDVKVVRGVDPLLDEEAIRVVKSSPKWEPAKFKGEKSKQQFTIPIAFVNDEQKSQQTDEQVFTVVEQMPVFPGGDKAFGEFISKEVKFPDDAMKAGTQGKVFVTFVVNKEGNVVNPKIARGVSPSLDKEALRVISNSPKWTPGKQKGKNVDVQFTLPIAFALK